MLLCAITITVFFCFELGLILLYLFLSEVLSALEALKKCQVCTPDAFPLPSRSQAASDLL